ncbi:MAG: energy transducer TonB [Xanthomonadales bacterium]|nr:energy transducer TonB [Xanthomonadales bacterium]
MVRSGIAFFLSIAVTFGLLFLMHILIATGQKAFSESKGGRIVDFVRVKRDETVERKKPKPKKPQQPEQPPPDMPQPQMDNMDMSTETVGIAPVSVDANINLTGNFGFGSADGEYLPIVKVAPVYPRRAQERGISGYVLLEFTVTKLGTVENPVVIEAEPPNIFNRAAIQAALKFKYKPRVVDGEPIAVHGVQNLIRFEIED